MKKNSMKYRIMAFMAKMMMACDKATFLISKKAEGKLTLGEMISLKMHLLSCKICSMYEKDINILNAYLKNEYACTHHLDNEQKTKIQGSIVKELNNN